MKNHDNETPHSVLHKLVYELIKSTVKSNERVNATTIGQELWGKVNQQEKFRVEMTMILAREGAHQFAMKAIQKFAPIETSTQAYRDRIDAMFEAE